MPPSRVLSATIAQHVSDQSDATGHRCPIIESSSSGSSSSDDWESQSIDQSSKDKLEPTGSSSSSSSSIAASDLSCPLPASFSSYFSIICCLCVSPVLGISRCLSSCRSSTTVSFSYSDIVPIQLTSIELGMRSWKNCCEFMLQLERYDVDASSRHRHQLTFAASLSPLVEMHTSIFGTLAVASIERSVSSTF